MTTRMTFWGICLLISFFPITWGSEAHAQVDEQTMIAVAFQKVSEFIEWPAGLFPSPESDFVIGVMGDNNFLEKIRDIYSGHAIKRRRVAVRQIQDLEELTNCHLLFIPELKRDVIDQILVVTRNKPVLTVGDTMGFANRGLLLNLLVEDEKLNIEVNLRGFAEAGLQISSALYPVVVIVDPDQVDH